MNFFVFEDRRHNLVDLYLFRESRVVQSILRRLNLVGFLRSLIFLSLGVSCLHSAAVRTTSAVLAVLRKLMRIPEDRVQNSRSSVMTDPPVVMPYK